jgi:transcriptional regulator with XRE-family HTH domain
MISEIERGGRAPTVQMLDRIATALGSSIARLTRDESSYEPVLLTRDNQAVLADPAGWERRILSPVLPGVEFEFMRGTLELTLDGASSRLGEGDSIFYPGDCRHGFANPAAAPCVYYLAMDVAGDHLLAGPRPAGSDGPAE